MIFVSTAVVQLLAHFYTIYTINAIHMLISKKNTNLIRLFLMLGAYYLIFITTASYSIDVKCTVSKYRNADGRCNNVHRPNWGKRNSPFLQFPSEVPSKVIILYNVTLFKTKPVLNVFIVYGLFKMKRIQLNGPRLRMWQKY